MTRRKKKPIPKLKKGQHWVLTVRGYYTRRYIKAENLRKKYLKSGEKVGRAIVYKKIIKEPIKKEIVEEKPKDFFRSMCTATSSQVLDKKDFRIYVYETSQFKHTAGDLQSELHAFAEAVDLVGAYTKNNREVVIPARIRWLYSVGELRTELDAIVLPDEVKNPIGEDAIIGRFYGEFSIKGYRYVGVKKEGDVWRARRE